MINRQLFLAWILLTVINCVHADDRDDGKACGQETGSEAFQACSRLAQKGIKGAQYNLGLFYERGEGVAKDKTQAHYWIRKAAEQGLPEAQVNLGQMLIIGEGTNSDMAQGILWLRRAADQGNSIAKFWLENVEEGSEGMELDPANIAADRRLPVDLTKSDERLLDSVAIVSNSTNKKMWAKAGWGSGFLVSKCHLLTAHHLVFLHGNPEKGIEEEPNTIGKEVMIGLGQITESPWKRDISIGKVIGFDPEVKTVIGEKKEYLYSDVKDWALVKLEKDKSGKYPSENRQPLCLNPVDQPILYNNAKQFTLRSVGHPMKKYLISGKLSLWQDANCKILASDGDSWLSNCQMTRGMSGGPVVTFRLPSAEYPNGCWMPIGVISSAPVKALGLTKEAYDTSIKNIDIHSLNSMAQINMRNRKKIQKAMDENPCN